jgi:hypothetical protein
LSSASDYDSKHVVNKGKGQVYAHELIHEDGDFMMLHMRWIHLLLTLLIPYKPLH